MVTYIIITEKLNPTQQNTKVAISKCGINTSLSNKCLKTVCPQLFLHITLIKELPQRINDAEHISEEFLFRTVNC
jgi:hypothetical protein